MLGLPERTEFNKRIPKQKFYENMDVSPALKRVFVEQIRIIYWRNKLAATTMNIAAGEEVTEIEVFEVRLQEPQFDETVLRQIDKEIPYHILFLLTCDRKEQAWIGYKEAAASGSNAFKVIQYYHTDWVPEGSLSFSIDGLNMDAVYATTVSRRRARVANRLFGSVILFAAALVLLGYMAMFLIGLELTTVERYHIVLGWVESDSYAGSRLCLAAIVVLFLALVGLFALAYRRMTKETRFRPLAVVLPALPALVGAAAVGWQRVQTALAGMPDYSIDQRTMLIQRDELEEALQTAGQGAQTGAAIVTAVLVVALLVLWRVTHGRAPLVSAVMLAVYAAIWMPNSALWLDIGYEEFIQVGGTEDITIQLLGLSLLLLLTVLCAGIALFADSLRRKKA